MNNSNGYEKIKRDERLTPSLSGADVSGGIVNEERLEARTTSASEHVERLTPSLLAKAFRGELLKDEG